MTSTDRAARVSSRRRFLARSGQAALLAGLGGGALALLNACTTATPSPTAAPSKPTEAPKPAAEPAKPTSPPAAQPAAPAPTTAPTSAAAPAAKPSGPKVTIRFGSIFPNTRPEHQNLELLAKRAGELTSGSVEVVVYPNSQLGSEREMTESVKVGTLDMTLGGGAIQGFVPEVGIFYLPYFYKDEDHFKRVWTLGKNQVADDIAKMVEEKAGIKTLGYYITGTRETITKNRPIMTLDDYKGLKIRVDDAPTSYATFKALGAGPVPVAFAEVYQALQTGVIDAAENPLSNIIGQKWYEVAKHLSLTGHLITLNLVMMNLDFWTKLPAEQQKALLQASSEAMEAQFSSAKNGKSDLIADLKSKGVTVTEVKDKSSFAEAVKPMHAEFVSKYHLEKQYEAMKNA